jgi:two-component system response regulator ChvI
VTCKTCPNCGFDLERVERLTIGELDIIGSYVLLWKGAEVKLPAIERLLVCALARAGGAPISRATICDIIGYEGDDPGNNADVHVCRVRKAFRAVDPAFDGIETCFRAGFRWRVPLALAA